MPSAQPLVIVLFFELIFWFGSCSVILVELRLCNSLGLSPAVALEFGDAGAQ